MAACKATEPGEQSEKSAVLFANCSLNFFSAASLYKAFSFLVSVMRNSRRPSSSSFSIIPIFPLICTMEGCTYSSVTGNTILSVSMASVILRM